jgi:broad specificity phosphatase PhoE
MIPARPLRRTLLALALALLPALASVAQAPAAAPPPARSPLPALVIVVRHAEKATEPKDDPPLTAAGQERAKALAATLAESGVTTILTTQWRRTKETAQPLATALGLTPEVVATDSAKGVEVHADEVAQAVGRHPGGVILIVGHSNTVPAIIAALGGPKVEPLADTAYDNLFLLTAGPGEAHLVRAHYGAPAQ